VSVHVRRRRRHAEQVSAKAPGASGDPVPDRGSSRGAGESRTIVVSVPIDGSLNRSVRDSSRGRCSRSRPR